MPANNSAAFYAVIRATVLGVLVIFAASKFARATLFSLNELFAGENSLGNTCWQINFADRVDCHPENSANEEACLQRGCCWVPPPSAVVRMDKEPFTLGGSHFETNSPTFEVGSRPTLQGAPVCFFPTHYNRTYFVTSVNKAQKNENGAQRVQATLELPQPTLFLSPDVKSLALDVTYENDYRLHLTLNDASPKSSRWQTPYPPLQPPQASGDRKAAPMYKFSMSESGSSFGFQINRASDNAVIFDATGVGAPLIFTDQLLMLSARLPGIQALYGLGEHWGTLNRLGGRYTFFGTDAPPMPNGRPGYGSIPLFIAMGASGDSELLAYGVYLHSSNAMEIEVTDEGVITYRVTGGILDFYFFFGPSPEDVVRQFTELVGRPQMPPYWSLGYHLSRWGLNTTAETQRIFQRNVDAGIPLQTQWNDIDYMISKQDFTYDPVAFANLSGFVQHLHDTGRNYVPIVDVGIPSFLPDGSYLPYDEGTADNVWVRSPNSDAPLVGQVWPGETVYPDFTHPNATAWWTRQVVRFHTDLAIDGMWIDMNEPSNFYDGSNVGCPSLADGNNLDYPPFQPPLLQTNLFNHTICMSARQHISTHYNLHNVYAYTEAVATHTALLETSGGQKRPFIITRSNSAGIGTVSAHWSGDVFSTWYDLQRSVAHALTYNMFGVPMVGSDICGFNGNTNEELCLRWHQVGAFYPFSRNHNSIYMVDQDPAAWSPPTIAAIRNVLNTRYQLLPHFYSMFAYATFHGGTVVRPLSFEFPHDIETYSIDWQFLIGSSVMILPVMEEGARSVTAYFPLAKITASDEIWYDFYTGGLMTSKNERNSSGVYKQLAAPLDMINIALRGGNIVPLQHEAMTLKEARLNKFFLYVAFSTPDVANGSASSSGTLYWDSGDDYNVMKTQEFNLIRFAAATRPPQHDTENAPVEFDFQILTAQAETDLQASFDVQNECSRDNALGWLTTTADIYNFTQGGSMILDMIRFSGVSQALQPKPNGNSVWAVDLKASSGGAPQPVIVSGWKYDASTEALQIPLGQDGLTVALDGKWVIYWC